MKNIKHYVIALALSASAGAATAQSTAIGTTTPNSSAELDVSSTTKGFLPPRLSLSQRGLISSPATGLVIYQTPETPGLYINNGTPASPSWIRLKPEVAPAYGTYKLQATFYQLPTGNSTISLDATATTSAQGLTFSTTGHSITILTSGTYELSFTVDIYRNSSSTASVSAEIIKGGNSFAGLTREYNVIGGCMSHHGYYDLVAGDVLQLRANTANPGDYVEAAYFSARLLN